MLSRTIKQGGSTPDRMFSTKLKGSPIDIELTYVPLEGPSFALGVFQLPMDDLAAAGHVRRRDDGEGFDLQIRVVHGEPWFWLNRKVAAPMGRWRS